MDTYHDKIQDAPRNVWSEETFRAEIGLPKKWHGKQATGRLWIALFLLGAVQLFTVVKLIEARHEVRFLTGEVTTHDDMLETLGDDVTLLEGKVRP